jgi:hypothetical protein
MFKKKGAIELSVNAIVVFVIALGMLGVGWFIIQKLKNLGGNAIDDVFDMDALQSQPSAQEPVVFDDTVKINVGEKTKIKGGFYNVDNTAAIEAIFDIKSCKDTDGIDVPQDNLPRVISSQKTVEPSKGYGFNILINHEEGDVPAGIYVCDFVIRGIDDLTFQSVYETKSVWMEVIA